MDAVERRLLSSTDAELWAQEFCKRFDGQTIVAGEWGDIVGWFANAIETARAS